MPALFFIYTNNVISGKSFWWDIIYRKRLKSGASAKKISLEQNALKLKSASEIEKYTLENFGEKAFKPLSDIDRPLTPPELKNFSREKYVHIGNHMADHAILANYAPAGIKTQILLCQQSLREITGLAPIAISYPNGSYSREVVRIAREEGMKIGITTEPRKNYLPIKAGSADALVLGRFMLAEGGDLSAQCDAIRSDISLYNGLKGRFCKKRVGASGYA